VSDIGVDAIKIGMLGSPAIAAIVADRLAALAMPIVFDPVMIATSGAALADAATIAAFERLMQLATVTTPNVAELVALGGHQGMAARGIAYLAKDGDGTSERVEDVLCLPGAEPHVMAGTRIHTRHTHGTGCTLSSAIATYLGRGLELPAAIDRARLFVRSALRAAPGLGAGNGPLGHTEARG
jgi:hydroxymethylpyrimidine/phosphomethylpyrimidine kinase